MRTCPNCGHMLSEKDTICFKCGMQLSQISSPGGNMGGGPMQAPPMMRAKGGQGGFPMNNGGNKDGDNKSIYIVLGVVVVLAIIAVVIVFVTKNNKVEGDEDTNSDVVLKQEEPEPKKEEPVIPPEDPEEPEEPEEPEQPEQPQVPEQPQQPTTPGHTTPVGGEVTVPEGYHLVSNNGYSYAVPDEYTAKDYGTQGFDILNYQKTKEMMISISLGTLENLKNTLPAVRQMYIDSGAVVHNIKVTTISDIEMICVELTKNSQNMIIGITDAAPGEIFVIAVLAVKTNDFNYDILAEGANIVKSAVKTAGGAVNTSTNA
ncbi:MAG: zinc ribbon domain-containing protein [Bacilli bacterium]|nr:zinc ribbon domain-containing protein [Bacilli bacterium]